jgi:hypothetical protein
MSNCIKTILTMPFVKPRTELQIRRSSKLNNQSLICRTTKIDTEIIYFFISFSMHIDFVIFSVR